MFGDDYRRNIVVIVVVLDDPENIHNLRLLCPWKHSDVRGSHLWVSKVGVVTNESRSRGIVGIYIICKYNLVIS